MEVTMNKRILYASLPIVALFCTGAHAQSIYTDPDVLDLGPSQQTTIYRTITRETLVPRTSTFRRAPVVTSTLRRAPVVAATEPRVRRSSVIVHRRPARLVRTTTTERIVTRPTNFVTADALDLTPNQRAVVFRTLVQQPTTVVTGPALTSPYARPYVTTEPVVTAPFGPVTTGVGVITDEPSGYVPASDLVIGARVPASIPLYAMPAETIAAAPSLGGYRYAVMNGRVYLVDPRDGIVAAMLYQ
jgi:hypothetical protein